MTKINPDDPAFPVSPTAIAACLPLGISTRLWLIGHIAQGLCANPAWYGEGNDSRTQAAIAQADMILAELNREKTV
jgi:hypothetical protein